MATLTAIHRIMKPDGSGFWEAGDSFDANELTDQGAYLLAGGHVTSSEGPAPVAEAAPNAEIEEENAKLKGKVSKLEVHAKKVNAYVAKLPKEQKEAFAAAMKAEEQQD